MIDPAEILREVVAQESGVPWAELLTVVKALADDAEMNRRMREEWRSMPTRTQQELCRYYAESRTWLMQTYNNHHGALEALAHGEKGTLPAWAERFSGMLPPAACILDYGGGFLKDSWFFVPRGHRVVLGEIEGPVIRIVESFLRRTAVTGVSVLSVRNADPAFGRYDGIVCFEVLEHILEPAALAKKMVASLPSGAPVAMSVSFGAPEHAPYHLSENAPLSDLNVWNAELRNMGLEPVWDDVSSIRLYRKT